MLWWLKHLASTGGALWCGALAAAREDGQAEASLKLNQQQALCCYVMSYDYLPLREAIGLMMRCGVGVV